MKQNEIMAVGLVVIAMALLFMQQQRIQPEAFVGQGQLRALGAVTQGCENLQLYSQCPQINPNTAIVSWCINEPDTGLFNPSAEVLNIMGRCYYPECAPNNGDLGSGFYLIENNILAGGKPAKLMRKVISAEPGYGIGEDIEISPGMKLGSSEISIVPKARTGDFTKGITGCIRGSLTYQAPAPATTTTTTMSAPVITTTTITATSTTIIYQIPRPPQADVFTAIQDIIQDIINFIRSFLPF